MTHEQREVFWKLINIYVDVVKLEQVVKIENEQTVARELQETACFAVQTVDNYVSSLLHPKCTKRSTAGWTADKRQAAGERMRECMRKYWTEKHASKGKASP